MENPLETDEGKARIDEAVAAAMNAQLSEAVHELSFQMKSVIQDSLTQIKSDILNEIEEKQAASNPTAPGAPTKNKSMKIKKENKEEIFRLPHRFNGFGDRNSDDDDASTISNLSNNSDIQFITALLNPKYKNPDAASKQEADRMAKIQEKYLNKIPILKYAEDEPEKHNYQSWKRAYIKYLSVLCPPLAETTRNFLSSIDIDAFIQNGDKVPFPKLPREDYPDLTKLSAMSAISASVSVDFDHLVDENTLTDIFPSLLQLHCFLQPNSDEDRSDSVAEFWNLRMGDENISQFGKKLRQAKEQINEQHGSVQISNQHLLAALKNGVKLGKQSEAFKDALLALRLQGKKLNFTSTITWLHHNRIKSSGAPSASAARFRGGGSGRGKGGKGRGGKGRGGGKNRGGISGTVTWKDSYYVVDGEEGEDTVTKPITQKQSNQPCFKQILEGKCNRKDCPYNHHFNIVDRRKDAGQNDSDQEENKASSSNSASSASSNPKVVTFSDQKNSNSAGAATSTWTNKDE